jgi:succinate-acetate transporter protein
MTDRMGLTEPGVKPARPSPRALLFSVVLWFVSALLWFAMVMQAQNGIQVLYVVLALTSLTLSVANFVMLRQSRKNGDGSRVDRTGQ